MPTSLEPDLLPPASPDERRIEYMVLGDIQPAEKNPKKHDIPGLIETMVHLGFGEQPLLDDRTGRLLAGHGRIEALLEMQKRGLPAPRGVRDVAGVWSIPVTRGYASESDAKAEAYLVSSNRQGEKGGWEGDALGDLLIGLADSGNLVGSGYDQTSLDALLKVTAETQTDLMDPGDGGASKLGAHHVPILRFGEARIPFTQEEADAFQKKLDLYINKTGSLYGLGRFILAGLPDGF